MQKEHDGEERERLTGCSSEMLMAPDSGLKRRKTRAEEKEEMMKRLLNRESGSTKAASDDDEKKPERDAFDLLTLDISREARAAACVQPHQDCRGDREGRPRGARAARKRARRRMKGDATMVNLTMI